MSSLLKAVFSNYGWHISIIIVIFVNRKHLLHIKLNTKLQIKETLDILQNDDSYLEVPPNIKAIPN